MRKAYLATTYPKCLTAINEFKVQMAYPTNESA